MYVMETFVEMGLVSLESTSKTLLFFVCFIFYFIWKKGHKWNEDHDFQTPCFFTLTQHCLVFFSLLFSLSRSQASQKLTDGFLNVSNYAWISVFSFFFTWNIFNLVFCSVCVCIQLKVSVIIFQVFIWFLFICQKNSLFVFNTKCVGWDLKMQYIKMA